MVNLNMDNVFKYTLFFGRYHLNEIKMNIFLLIWERIVVKSKSKLKTKGTTITTTHP